MTLSHTDTIFRLNLNYKNLLQCVNRTKVLRRNLNYKKVKLSDTLALYIFDLSFKMWENVSILPIFYAFLLLYYDFSYFVIHQSHTLVGYHAIGINSLFVFFHIFCIAYIYYTKP